MKRWATRLAGYICAAAFALFTPGVTLLAAVEPSESAPAIERSIMDAFYRGGYHDLFRIISDAVSRQPQLPETYLYYFDVARFADVFGYDRAAGVLSAALSALRAGGDFQGRNSLVLTLTVQLDRVLRLGRSPDASRTTAFLRPLRRWRIAGPYHRYGRGDIDHQFLPELSHDFEKAGVKSRTVTLRGGDGALDCRRYLYPSQGVAYALTSITLPHPVKVRVYADTEYALFINGRKVLANLRGGTYRSCRVVRVWGVSTATLMIKMLRGDSWRCRVIVTDEHDIPISAETPSIAMSAGDFQHIEEMDYPYGEYVARSVTDPEKGYSLLGGYFDELDSDESIQYYRLAAKSGETLPSYFYGSALIAYSGSDRGSARHLEGWRVLDAMSGRCEDFIPLRHKMFSRWVEAGDYRKAYLAGRDLYPEARHYFPFRRDYASVMRALGYDRELEEEIAAARRDFPGSLYLLEKEADWFREKNPEAAMRLYAELISKKRAPLAVGRFASLLREAGKYDEALSLLNSHGGEGAFALKRTDLHLVKNDYPAAKRAVFEALLMREDPHFYLRLGSVLEKTGGDPRMHWQRLLFIRPSHFPLDEYMRYLDTGEIANPLAGLTGDKFDTAGATKAWLKGEEKTDRSSVIIHRGRYFLLNSDGGSRVFCEDLVYLRDRKIIDRWGEYRVAYRGDFHPVRVRVHYREGGHSDAFAIHEVDDVKYLNISSLREGSVLHVAYLVDNPVTEPRGSSFFSVPLTEIQDFRESVRHFSLKIVVPKGARLGLFISPRTQIGVEEGEEHTVYSAELGPQAPVYPESFMGSKFNHLPCFAFSTMEDLKDVAAWYGGLLRGAGVIDGEKCRAMFGNRDTGETIRAVYEHIVKHVELRNGRLYYPGRAEDTLYAGRGSAEDRAVLARAMLSSLGISSFLALASRSDDPDTPPVVSPSLFSDVLVYAPLRRGRGVWMDFSGEQLPFGSVSAGLEERDAMVLLGGGYEMRKVPRGDPGVKRTQFLVTLREDGSAHCEARLSFSGRRGEFRKYFSDPSRRDDGALRYAGALVPSIDLASYRAEAIDDPSRPFVLEFNGESFAFAAPGKERMSLQPVIAKSLVYDYVRYEKRTKPLYLVEALREDDRYEYRFPDGYLWGEPDREARIDSRFGKAVVSLKRGKDPNTLVVEKTITIEPGVIAPSEYADFVDFCVKLKEAEHRNIVLKRR